MRDDDGYALLAMKSPTWTPRVGAARPWLKWLLVFMLAAVTPASAQETVPRTIIALYDSGRNRHWENTDLHRMAELVLNNLGLIVEPHDVNAPLPDLSNRPDVRGIISWWRQASVPDPISYLAWAQEALRLGKRFAILGSLGFLDDREGKETPRDLSNGFLEAFGVRLLAQSYDPSFSARAVIKNSAMVEFERKLPVGLAINGAVESVNPENRIYLRAARPGFAAPVDLVLVGGAGGLVAEGYTHYEGGRLGFVQWYLDPFAFFTEAFELDVFPVPDVTTLAGNRVFFSHVDGEGWRLGTDVQPYKSQHLRAIDVLIDRVFANYPHLPATVAPVAGDLDPDWCGDAAAQDAARRLFALPHIAAGTQTYSQPLHWRNAEADTTALPRSSALCSGSRINGLSRRMRAYPMAAFDRERELAGSAAYIEQFLPAGKRVELVQWSGDALPSAATLRAAERAGLLNLNGGDPRFNGPFDSIASVSPLVRATGNAMQVYTAAANENLHTSLWEEHFYGFRRVSDVMELTDGVRRLQPLNVHYSIASGSETAGLSALTGMLDDVSNEEITPVSAAEYVGMVEGFFSARIVRIGDGVWRIEDRGALQTVRFDNAIARGIDMDGSRGVLGWRRVGTRLYVALDPKVLDPVVKLDDISVETKPAVSLVKSRWPIRGLRTAGAWFSFQASGYGAGEMAWRVPSSGRYGIEATVGEDERRFTVAPDSAGVIAFALPADPAARTVSVRVLPLETDSALAGDTRREIR